MSVLAQLEAKAKAGSVDRVLELVREELVATRSYDGCREIAEYRCDDGHTVIFIGRWDSKDQYEQYTAWRRETGVMGDFVALLDGAPGVRFFEAIDA